MPFSRPLFFGLSLCFFCLLPATAVLAGETPELPWTVHVYFKNDLFTGTDRNYTNGVKISVISPDLVSFVESGKLPDWSLEYIYRLPFIKRSRSCLKAQGGILHRPEYVHPRRHLPQ
ncbi:MAG: lipid A deacylase LpxR family protein [Desulfobulbaceae bacterium]|nr:lipid A deacylase LpxR family protein [Desulfobulbaceae bacterium]